MKYEFILFIKRFRYRALFIICFATIVGHCAQAQIDDIFRNTYAMYEQMRNDIGIYRDSKLLSGTDYHPASVANVGVGLISLCIADTLGWELDAKAKALTTLKSITGNTSGFSPDRNASGYYRHFIDMNTGARAWDSEYSTIDTDILAMGAMFAKNYFKDSDITFYADQLWNSIDFTKAIANPSTGQIYLTMDSSGNGISSSLTSTYNEYMIVAWLAKNDPNNNADDANLLWNNYYGNVANILKKTYAGYECLTDHEARFLPSFTHQFNYFLCNYFPNSTIYMQYFENAKNADEAWGTANMGAAYEWGCGAGCGPNGYHADAIEENPDKVVSPHIIGGFSPIEDPKTTLLQLYNNNKGVYLVPGTTDKFLWRYSMDGYSADAVQGIDLSSMLFGLAALPEYLGTAFFELNNRLNI